MDFKCPGVSDVVRPTIELFDCPYCKAEVEIFTDEEKATCVKCGKIIFKNKRPTCFDWCEYAKKCAEELEKQQKEYEEARKN